MAESKGTSQGGLGVGARLNGHDEKIKELAKKVTRLERQAETNVEDLNMSGKGIRICMDDGECFNGTVVGISRFRIRLRLDGSSKERTFSKGHIRWHEEL